MTGAAQMLTIRVPLAVRKRGGRKLVVTPSSAMSRGPSGADSTLVKALARAFRWRRMMETGRFDTLNALAAAEKINSSYVSRLLRLTLLSPDIVDAILEKINSSYVSRLLRLTLLFPDIVEAMLDGRQQEGITLPGLMDPFPVEWEGQRAALCLETSEA